MRNQRTHTLLISPISLIVVGSLLLWGLSHLITADANIPPDTEPGPINVALEEWKQDMRICESSDNPNAINEVDLDGTASIGLWQFKIGTWKSWNQKYQVFPVYEWDEADYWNTIYSREHQDAIIDAALEDPTMDWAWHFPGCIKKHGLPPVGEKVAHQ